MRSEPAAVSPARRPSSRACLFASLLCAAVARAQDATGPEEPARPEERVDAGGLPMVNYDSNFGAGLGLNVGLFFRRRGFEPYQYSLRAQGYFTTGGYQEHYLAFDAPQLFGSPYRVSGRVAYVRDAFKPFYGFGNALAIPPPDDPGWGTHRYEVDDSSFQLDLGGHRVFDGRWKLGLRYVLYLATVRAYPGSVAESLAPLQLGDGPEGLLTAEAQYDGRDAEASPTRGVHAILEVYGSHPLLLSGYSYAGVRARVAGYWSPFGNPYLVIAARVLGDYLAGTAPLRRFPDLGGDSTVRGLPRGRALGNARAVFNLEARSRALRFRPWTHELDVWLVAFGDLGRVWAEGGINGPPTLWHPAYGAGVRLAWEEDYVVRFDLATGPGQGPSLFIVFNHPY